MIVVLDAVSSALACLHALAHVHSSVNGILLGRPTDGASIVVDEVVPLTHCNIGLSPITEAALALVSEYATSCGLVILGCYHANEHPDDASLSAVASAIGARLCASNPRAIVLLLDGNALARTLSTTATSAESSSGPAAAEPVLFSVHSHRADGWSRPAGAAVTLADGLADVLRLAAAERLERSVVDVDDHFDAISSDFRNEALRAQLASLALTSRR